MKSIRHSFTISCEAMHNASNFVQIATVSEPGTVRDQLNPYCCALTKESLLMLDLYLALPLGLDISPSVSVNFKLHIISGCELQEEEAS